MSNTVKPPLPANARLPKNFGTFDYYDEATHLAVSVKTLDTQTLSKLTKPNQIYTSIRGNIDKAARFEKVALNQGQIRIV
ncbi:hypothetical protein [Xenorhabdus lircayensis]|uniref:CdiA toxin EC869-like domain-containing protein n=1 Tax=Xenorhabdus lircayensis TaxID=2763499 RepID=A0ABS0U435_9GAMM|nr:hypothetical protein [Xenorhabdus lircayensis]MBI6548644.1 hypothetical protein [Xenorhabdus lircayensis]